MAILLTGGTGKTSSRTARILQAAGKQVILASRNPSSSAPTPTSQSVKFDWTDPSTYNNAFKTSFGKIESAYLLSPARTVEVFPVMKAFIDFLIEKGVRRLVFMSASTVEAGGPAVGKVHEYIVGLGVDYAVVRPSWFFENGFTLHFHDIKANDEIVTASEDGKMGFISADDIAEVIADALLVEKSYNTDFIIVGPELLSYDQVAETYSSVLGRTIKHIRVSIEELKKHHISIGLPEDYAGMLSWVESLNVSGVEERAFGVPASKKRVGKIRLREFIEENKSTWIA